MSLCVVFCCKTGITVYQRIMNEGHVQTAWCPCVLHSVAKLVNCVSQVHKWRLCSDSLMPLCCYAKLIMYRVIMNDGCVQKAWCPCVLCCETMYQVIMNEGCVQKAWCPCVLCCVATQIMYQVIMNEGCVQKAWCPCVLCCETMYQVIMNEGCVQKAWCPCVLCCDTNYVSGDHEWGLRAEGMMPLCVVLRHKLCIRWSWMRAACRRHDAPVCCVATQIMYQVIMNEGCVQKAWCPCVLCCDTNYVSGDHEWGLRAEGMMPLCVVLQHLFASCLDRSSLCVRWSWGAVSSVSLACP